MLWMARLALGSAIASIFVVRIYDQLGISDGVSHVARPVLSVASGTAVTVGMGMSGFKSKVRSLRQQVGKRFVWVPKR